MNRGTMKLWAFFALAAVVAGGGLVWLTVVALRLEHSERLAEAQADYHDRLRRAMWRLDSRLLPELAQEASRPYSHYSPFHSPTWAYNRKWVAFDPRDVLLPSPLVQNTPDWIQVHFQIAPNGTISSPQVPVGKMRDLAKPLGLDADHNKANEWAVRQVERINSGNYLQDAALGNSAPASAPNVQVVMNNPAQVLNLPQPSEQQTVQGLQGQAAQNGQRQQKASSPNQADARQQRRTRKGQREQSREEFQHRHQRFLTENVDNTVYPQLELHGGAATTQLDIVQGNLNQEILDVRLRNASEDPPALVEETAAQQAAELYQSGFAAVWAKGAESRSELLFLRQIVAGEQRYVQGFWVNWQSLKTMLEDEVHDLFPNAQLKPLRRAEDLDEQRAMTVIPALLETGEAPLVEDAGMTPTRVGLACAWVAFGMGLLAVGLGLRSLVDLTERRLDFVSAVTHELRTPLTTFRMYTEMLSEGMVPEERRIEYCRTLQQESDRLSHLVQNVLDYSRLERRAWAPQTESIGARALLDRLAARVTDRCAAAEMDLKPECECPDQVMLRTDPHALEQVIYNLVDNSCKYARAAEDRRIHLHVRCDGNAVVLEVADHGPGVASEVLGRMFQPFYRGLRGDASREPGVGLGLALARRWARTLGGDLEAVNIGHVGACFRVRLKDALV